MLKLKKLVAFIVIILFSFSCYSQSNGIHDSIGHIIEQNLKKLATYKTKLSKAEIENLLSGSWKFICLETSNGVKIDTMKTDYYDSEGNYHQSKPEKTEQPGLAFLAEKRYIRFDDPKTNASRGSWYYDDTFNALVLEYDSQYYPPDVESVMKNILKIPGLKKEYIWLYKITTEDLFIMEQYPINENEKWFYLKYFKKTPG